MKEITTQTGWLTQAALENEENRIFVKRVFAAAINEADWRKADDAEKAAWEQEYLKEPEL